jgi:hypothetical protein
MYDIEYTEHNFEIVLSNLLRRLITNTDNHSLQKPELIELIQQGVSNRLQENALGILQRQCAEVGLYAG